jgi:long-chain acyl-CoA synthetase
VPGTQVSFSAEGEILAKGPGIMQGYFRNDEGHSRGDRGRLVPHRRHRPPRCRGQPAHHRPVEGPHRHGRRKKVAPQPLEGKLKASKWVSEAVMLGDKRPYCIACSCPTSPISRRGEGEGLAQGFPP